MSLPPSSRTYDLVVYGAYGFTGKLICEYIVTNYPDIRWAIGGRDQKSLSAVREKFGLKESVGNFVVGATDAKGLLQMTSQTKVVLNAAGPFTIVGPGIVEACIAGGSHYCDITGEPPFVRNTIDNFHNAARNKKLKIVNCCGYDCIPSDLGVQMMVDAVKERGLVPKGVTLFADDTKGSVSYGTLLSIITIFDKSSFSQLIGLLNPFYLNPRDEQDNRIISPPLSWAEYLQCLDFLAVGYDTTLKTWTAPYMMQSIDTRIINRSNALQNYGYGKHFVFNERFKAPNVFVAALISFGMSAFSFFIIIPFVRSALKWILPKLEKGPNQDILDTGYFSMKYVATGLNEATGVSTKIVGSLFAARGDPGYRQTAKMVTESALCLSQDKLSEIYGVLTPSVAMGPILRKRLANKGFEFLVAND